MSKVMGMFYRILFLVLAAAILLLNFILQGDYFKELHLSDSAIILSIIALDSSKVLSEIWFFKIEHLLARILLALLALTLMILSAYTAFAVREWKALESSDKINAVNKGVKLSINEITLKKNRLNNELTMLNEQINTKRKIIESYIGKQKSKWTIYQYNKEIDELNKTKSELLKKLDSFRNVDYSHGKSKTGLAESISQSLSIDGKKLETVQNIVLAIIIELILFFYSFAFSTLSKDGLNNKPGNHFTKRKNLINEAKKIDWTQLKVQHINGDVLKTILAVTNINHFMTEVGIQSKEELESYKQGVEAIPAGIKEKILNRLK